MGAVGKSSGFDYEAATKAIADEVAKHTNSYIANAAVLDTLPIGSYIVIREKPSKTAGGDSKLYQYAKKVGDNQYTMASVTKAGGGTATILDSVFTSVNMADYIRSSKHLKFYNFRLTGDINDRKQLWKPVL